MLWLVCRISLHKTPAKNGSLRHALYVRLVFPGYGTTVSGPGGEIGTFGLLTMETDPGLGFVAEYACWKLLPDSVRVTSRDVCGGSVLKSGWCRVLSGTASGVPFTCCRKYPGGVFRIRYCTKKYSPFSRQKTDVVIIPGHMTFSDRVIGLSDERPETSVFQDSPVAKSSSILPGPSNTRLCT